MPVPVTTDVNFTDDVLHSDLPVLVEFTATWCGPCRMIAPVLDEIAQENPDRLRIVSLDVDTNPETTRAYQVMSMPTMMLFENGAPVKSMVGARPKRAILADLEPHLKATTGTGSS